MSLHTLAKLSVVNVWRIEFKQVLTLSVDSVLLIMNSSISDKRNGADRYTCVEISARSRYLAPVFRRSEPTVVGFASMQ